MYSDRDTLMKVLDLIMELDLQESMILIGSWDEFFYERLYNGFPPLLELLILIFLFVAPFIREKNLFAE